MPPSMAGLVIGALARFFYPGAVEMGWGMTMLLGIGGSLLAGFASTVGWPLTAWLAHTWGWREACATWAVLHLVQPRQSECR